MKNISLVSRSLMLCGFVLLAGTVVAAEPTSRATSAQETVCANKEAAITKRSTQLMALVQRQEQVFTAISQRVQTYYFEVMVPKDQTIVRYDDLVLDTTSKLTTVQAALGKAQATAAGFSCDSAEPRAQLTGFREDMQAVKTTLKEYRTSIKKLIEAVRVRNQILPSNNTE